MSKIMAEVPGNSDFLEVSGVRCYERDGVAYLKLEDVARGLGFTQTKNGTEYVRWETVNGLLAEFHFPNLLGKTSYIPENIFYRLAMKAKNETAEKFQATVADVVIPSIRKHGAYITPDTIDKMIATPEFGIKLLTALKDEQEKNRALEAENALQKQAIADFEPIKQYVDTILESKGTLATTQIAADYGMSAQQLNRVLKEEGIQWNVNGQWILRKKYMGMGLTSSKTIQFTHADGRHDTRVQTVWTQKGRIRIHEILTARGITAVMDRDYSFS